MVLGSVCSCTGVCLQSLEQEITGCFFRRFSQEELQQWFHSWNPWTEWRGWGGADCHQSVFKVSNHLPPHPAACQRSRLQAHPGQDSSQSQSSTTCDVTVADHVCNRFIEEECDEFVDSVLIWSHTCSSTVREEHGDVPCASMTRALSTPNHAWVCL